MHANRQKCAVQSGTEAPDRPVLFVEATPDPSPPPSSPHMGPLTSSRASQSPRPAGAAPIASALPHQAVPTVGPRTAQLDSQTQQGSDAPPPGMPLRDWIKQRKKTAAAAGANAFPSIQVYCPHGSQSPTIELLRASAPPQSPSALTEQQYEEIRSTAPGSSTEEAVGESQTAAASQMPAR